MKATLKIRLRDKDINDALLEKIGDVGFEQGAEGDGSNLVYTLTDDDEDKLIERVDSFKQVMWEFFDSCEAMSLVTVKYGDEEAEEDGGVDINPAAGLPVVPLAKNSKTPLVN
jgi:hypothetical protein